MNNFSVGAAFSEAAEFAKRNLTNLLILFGGSVVVGQILQTVMLGGSLEAMTQQMTPLVQNGDTAAIMSLAGGVFAAAFVGAILQSTAQFAVLRQGLSGEQDIGSTLGYGLVATIVNLLFWGVIIGVFALVLGIIIGATGLASSLANSDSPAGAIAALGGLLLVFLFLMPVLVWLAARLFVAAPAMAAERSVNPLYGLAASWRLTAGPVQWPVLGTVLIYIVAMFLASMLLGVIGGIFTLVGGATVGGLVSGILTGIPVGIAGLAMSAGVYRALVPDNVADVFG